MTEATAKLRHRTRAAAIVIAACASLVGAGTADARPYTVVSCDSAGLFGHSSAAWAPFANAGSTYATCPSGGGLFAGISDRLTGATYGGFSFSGHAFTAPPGTSITRVRWAGRMARDNCSWGTYIRAVPSGAAVLGLPPNQFCTTSGWDTRGWPMPYGVPSGTTRLEQFAICGARECAPGAAMHTHNVEVTIEDPTPPSISLSGPLASGRWVSGASGHGSVTIDAADAAGVQRVEATLGHSSFKYGHPCNWATAVPCPSRSRLAAPLGIGDLPDGVHTMRVSAYDAALNPIAVSRDVHVDNTAPEPVVPVVVGGEAWRRTNGFVATWANPPNQMAPIVRVHWKLCLASGGCVLRGEKIVGATRDVALQAPAAGDYRLHLWLEDAAGNRLEANAAVAVRVRYDPEPPSLSFEDTDVGDPLRVAVNTFDRHSGVARGQIEMRAAGTATWHGLATQLEGSQLVAYVDDERFRHGTYQFRAHAVDAAGNEASTDERADGTTASLRLPARIETRLRVGLVRRVTRRRIVRRHGRRRVVLKRVRRLDSRVSARFRSSLRLTGSLTNADGHPLAGATVEALEPQADGSLLPLGFASTGELGEFRYVIEATRNRHLVFRYPGSKRIGVASTDFELLVPASSSMRSSRAHVRNGEEVLFSGRVRTHPVPAAGKLVELQAYFRGRWRTFSTVRATSGGRWRFPYRFGATFGRVTYRFRVVLPAEGGYPFVTGRSPVVGVVVTGP